MGSTVASNSAVKKADGRRTRHEARKPELLEAITKYVGQHGPSNLSLRPLAEAVGVSHRTLLYHFGSKEELLLAVLEKVQRDFQQIVERQAELFGNVPPTHLIRFAWQHFANPVYAPLLRMLFEMYALGMQGDPYDRVIRALVKDWLDIIVKLLIHHGCPPERGSAIATLIYAAANGVMLDALLTGDMGRLQGALDELLTVLESFLLPSFNNPRVLPPD